MIGGNKTWVKLYRKTEDHPVFRDPGILKLWIWCLLRVNWEPKKHPFKSGEYLKPGQFVTGREVAARALDIPKSTFRNRLRRLAELGVISTKADSRCTVVTVCKWGTYNPSSNGEGQAKGQQKDSDRTAIGQQKDTDKNIRSKEGKKDKKKETQRQCEKQTIPPDPKDVEKYAAKIGYREATGRDLDAEQFMAHYAKCGWKIRGQPIKSWKACVVTWKTGNKAKGNNHERSRIARKAPDGLPVAAQQDGFDYEGQKEARSRTGGGSGT